MKINKSIIAGIFTAATLTSSLAQAHLFGNDWMALTTNGVSTMTKESLNTVNSSDSYKGGDTHAKSEEHGYVVVSKVGSMLSTDTSEIICNNVPIPSKCKILVESDVGSGEYFLAEVSNIKNQILITDPNFLKKVKRSKLITVEVELRNKGTTTFYFDVRGLKLK